MSESISTTPTPEPFHWEPQSAAQALVHRLAGEFLDRIDDAATLAHRMRHETGARFVDWLDFIEVPEGGESPGLAREELQASGFISTGDRTPTGAEIFENTEGIFPRLILSSDGARRIGVKVEFVADFLAAWSITNDHQISGEPFAPVRFAPAFVDTKSGAELWVVERHGYRGFEVGEPDPAKSIRAMQHLESLRRRERDWENDDDGWTRVFELVDRAIEDLGPDRAADIFFTAEREYWQRRNRAARIQKSRQDALGLGWANHDHHTYRSTRMNFHRLIELFERLGMRCRERFYAGAEAGWGAQVLEQPNAGIVVFADVDLSPEEIAGDFAHHPIPPRDWLGTVGLWCGLHGESVLQSGMHHLECQFDHEALCDQLAAAGVNTMAPFTNLPYLRQAFTEGERWKVSEKRIARLLEANLITSNQAMQFRMHGAIGSHLENLERNDGYKGFNQKGVSDIIHRTDPRRDNAELVGA
ncbi:MAG: hypothetical protein ACF8PN_10120 [Phycisphaerales bacterium]